MEKKHIPKAQTASFGPMFVKAVGVDAKSKPWVTRSLAHVGDVKSSPCG